MKMYWVEAAHGEHGLSIAAPDADAAKDEWARRTGFSRYVEMKDVFGNPAPRMDRLVATKELSASAFRAVILDAIADDLLEDR